MEKFNSKYVSQENRGASSFNLKEYKQFLSHELIANAKKNKYYGHQFKGFNHTFKQMYKFIKKNSITLPKWNPNANMAQNNLYHTKKELEKYCDV